MKKYLITTILVLAIIACTCCLFACKDEEATQEENIVLSATLADDVTYVVGDAFDSSDIVLTATLKDETKTVITTTAATTYDKTGLKLDENGKFTEDGTFTLKITYLTYSTTLDITVAAK